MTDSSLPHDLLSTFASTETKKQRQELLRLRPSLRTAEAVEALCDQANHRAQKDPALASRFAEAAVWLATTLKHPPAQGLAHRTLANILSALAKPSEALAQYTAALEHFQHLEDNKQAAITRSSALATVTDTLGAEVAFEWAAAARDTFEETQDQLRLARLENNLAVLLFRQDDFPRALHHWKAAYKTLTRIGKPSDQAAALRNLAVCSISLNEPGQARSYYKKARTLCEANHFTFLLHEIDYNIAYLHYLEGDHHRALALYQAARRRSRELGDTYHEAYCSLDETEVYIELNLYEEASTVAQLAESQFSEQQRPYETAKAMFNLALVKYLLGDPRGALEKLSSTAKAFLGLGNLLWPGQVELLRAQVYTSEGRLFEARRSAAEARRRFRESSLLRRAALAELLLAKIYLSQSHLADAEDLCRSALRVLAPLGEPYALVQANSVLSQILEEQDQQREAVDALRTAERYLSELRNRRTAALTRISVGDGPPDVYGNLVRLLLVEEDERSLATEAFRLIEMAKARSLADRLTQAEQPTRSPTKMRSQLVDQVSTLRRELDWLYRRIDRSELQDAATNPSLVARLQAESQAKESELARTLSSLREGDPSRSTDPSELGVAAVGTVQDLLRDSVFVDYFVASGLVLAAVLSRSGRTIHPIAVGSAVQDLQRQLWYYFNHVRPIPEHASGQAEELSLQILQRLYDELLRPIEEAVGDAPIIIAPHSFLFLVPFHALHDGSAYLIERQPVSYVPSGSALASLTGDRPLKGKTVRIFGHPESGGEDPSLVPSFLKNLGQTYHPNRFFHSNPRGRPRSLETSAAHLIGAAQLRKDNPLFSRLQIGGGELTLLDLHRSQPLCALITLEGTGFGADSPNGHTEVEGLWRTLLNAGARSILVPDGLSHPRVHRKLSSLFYAALARGEKAAVAHQQAVLAMRSRGAALHEWAGMLLIGDPFLTLEVGAG